MSVAQVKEWIIEYPYIELACELGEGPYYEKETHSLRLVDIKAKRIHWVSLTDDRPAIVSSLQLDVSPSLTANIRGWDPRHKILIAVKHGLATLDRTTGHYNYICKLTSSDSTQEQRLRTNDGAVDPTGAILVGTMTDFEFGSPKPEGSLLHIRPFFDEPLVLLKGLTVPNGIGWSPDAKTMYFVSSGEKKILCFRRGEPREAPAVPTVFYQHGSEGGGEPDGLRVDVEGHIWVAIWGESCVLRISPDGQVVGSVKLPTKFVTCVQFVGEHLFVTTASDKDERPGRIVYGGALYRVHVGVHGLEPYLFKLDP